ncbi:MAG: hypothetical protein A2X86_19365 [Bdellovibrionales bacterium GWA2_49_15]|nr:MAG: hypothetical protein A2X86_19365 [Bdellovibrionales bacterium GWA2_49_15]HAZ14389.1 hypothetical protein [Bdellovibrionales bacterium]
MKYFALLTITIFLFSSCATREEIQRRELLKNLSEEVQTGQKTSSEVISKIQEYEERMNAMDGRIEEMTHRKDQNLQRELESIKNNLRLIKEEVETLKQGHEQRLTQLEAKQNEQQKFMDQIVSTLEKLSHLPASTSKKNKKADAQGESPKEASAYDEAMANYNRGNFQEAREMLTVLLHDKSIKGLKLAKVLHNLGMSEFKLGNFEGSTAYFGRLYTDFPSSTLNSTGLLSLGKALAKIGKKEEAKQAFQELIDKFSKTKAAAEAKKLLEKT